MAGLVFRMIAVSLFAGLTAMGSAIAQDFTVGPYPLTADRNQSCTSGCQSYGATWDGTFSTTTGQDFSCGCKTAAAQQPATTQQQQTTQGTFPVGPFQLNQDRNAVCPSACQSYNATWNGGISTTTGNDFNCTCALANQNVTQPQGVRPSTPPADRDSAGQQFIQPPQAAQQPQAQQAGAATGQMTAAERQLFDLINAYRAQNGLPAVPESSKLTLVAQTHARDTVNFPPAQDSLHSWSNSGNWTGGFFDLNNQNSWPIMWNKPKEIAGYSGHGYEISAGDATHPSITPAQALDLWKTSSGHNTVILNQGTWASFPWQAMGVGIYRGVAHVWFGKERQ